MRRYMVCMIPRNVNQYDGYVVLGVYADSHDQAEELAASARPDCWVDDVTVQSLFPTFYPYMHARFQEA